MDEPNGASNTYRAFPGAIDDLQQALLDAEDSLNSMLDKVSAETILEHGTDYHDGGEADGWAKILIFHKVGRSWRLDYYDWWDHLEPGDETIVHIVDAPLRMRILATEKLPELLDVIRKQRAQKIEEVRVATEAARVFSARVLEEEATRDKA